MVFDADNNTSGVETKSVEDPEQSKKSHHYNQNQRWVHKKFENRPNRKQQNSSEL